MVEKEKARLINWSPIIACGVKIIDDQHKALVNVLNDMFNHVSRNKDAERAYFSKVIPKLVDYVRVHFQTEEKLMLHTKFHGYIEHQKKHISFVQVVSENIQNFEKGKTLRLLDFTNFLKDWILTHIAIMDKQYSFYFKKIATRKANGELTINQSDIVRSEKTGELAAPTGIGKKRILLVDDDVTHLTTAKEILKNDYQAFGVKSGLDALNLFYKGFVPDLILLDLIMPGMDGWETYNRVKTISNLYSVPTAIFTSSTDPQDPVRARKLGVNDFIKKPVKKNELLDRIKKLVKA